MTSSTPVARAAGNLRELSIRPYAIDKRRCVVRLSGEVDLASAAGLKAALSELAELGYSHFVLDLTEMTHIDSTGLGVLVGFQRRLEQVGHLSLASVPANVSRLLSVVGLNVRMESFPTVDAALVETGPVGQLTPVAVDTSHLPPPSLTSEADPGKGKSRAAPVAAEAALALGLASTALPFAESPLAEAERWLRILRRYGDAGRILHDAGVREAPFADFAADVREGPRVHSPVGANARLDQVTELTNGLAARNACRTVGTVEVLKAVLAIYGSDFDRVLAAYGGDPTRVHEHLDTV